MASTPTFTPNPYANFDPSQWSNPYSNFQNSAIPFPATYSGWPTDASGNPIQPTPGMTLNSSPAQPAAPAAGPAVDPQTAAMARSLYNSGNAAMPSGDNFVASGNNPSGANPAASSALAMMNAGMAGGYNPNMPAGSPLQGAATAPAPAAAAPGAGTPLQVGQPLTPQQYLQLRANPGHVTTPRATVPQAPSAATPGPGMLQSFLANWNPATSGPGSGFQQAFSKALRGS